MQVGCYDADVSSSNRVPRMGADCDINAEFDLLCALHQCRSNLINNIIAFAQQKLGSLSDDEKYIDGVLFVDILTKGETLHLAEWLFAIQAMDLKSGDNMKTYLEHHNKAIEELINVINASPGKISSISGVSLDRAKHSIFPQKVINRICLYKEFGQSDIARLHIEVASAETWRVVLLALERGGFISRMDIGTQIIKTNGVIEGFVGDYLKDISRIFVPNGGGKI